MFLETGEIDGGDCDCGGQDDDDYKCGGDASLDASHFLEPVGKDETAEDFIAGFLVIVDNSEQIHFTLRGDINIDGSSRLKVDFAG